MSIHRAKKFKSEKYVIGYLQPKIDGKYYLLVDGDLVQVDKTTLAIHLPKMIDKKKNKIFASVNRNGKGGDIVPIHTCISKCDAIFYFDTETMSVRLLEKSDAKFTWEYGIVLNENNKVSKEIIGIEK